MGRVVEAKFNRRYNVGQYEHEDYTLTATLDEGDDTLTVLAGLKETVAAAYGGETVTAPPAAATPGKKKPKKDKKAKKEEEAEPEETEEEETEETEEEETEEQEEEETEEEEIESDPDEETEEAEEEEAPPPKKAKKTFKKKPQVYDRDSDAHKDIFSNVLKELKINWKKDDVQKVKAKNVSRKMNGKDFLDEHGEVVDSFKDEVKKLMAKK